MVSSKVEERAISITGVEEIVNIMHQTTCHIPADSNFEPTRHCGTVTKQTKIQIFATKQTSSPKNIYVTGICQRRQTV